MVARRPITIHKYANRKQDNENTAYTPLQISYGCFRRMFSVIIFLPVIPVIALSPLLEFKCFRTALASSQMSSSTQSTAKDLLCVNGQHVKNKWFSAYNQKKVFVHWRDLKLKTKAEAYFTKNWLGLRSSSQVYNHIINRLGRLVVFGCVNSLRFKEKPRTVLTSCWSFNF